MNKPATTTMHYSSSSSSSITKKLVQDCYNESDIDNKVQILFKINSLPPRMYRINIPPLITDDYIDAVLFQIEKSMHWL
jgi:hypothetical protein